MDPRIEELVSRLDSEDAGTRLLAIQELSSMSGPDVQTALRVAAESPDSAVRAMARKALAGRWSSVGAGDAPGRAVARPVSPAEQAAPSPAVSIAMPVVEGTAQVGHSYVAVPAPATVQGQDAGNTAGGGHDPACVYERQRVHETHVAGAGSDGPAIEAVPRSLPSLVVLSFEFYFRNLPRILMVASVLAVPGLLLLFPEKTYSFFSALADFSRAHPGGASVPGRLSSLFSGREFTFWAAVVTWGVSGYLSYVWLGAALNFMVADAYLGRKPGAFRSLWLVLRKTPVLFCALAAQSIGGVAILFPMFAYFFLGGRHWAAKALSFVPFVDTLLPVVVVLCTAGIFVFLVNAWSLAVPVAMVEGRWFLSSLLRSHRLVRGNFLRTAFINVLISMLDRSALPSLTRLFALLAGYIAFFRDSPYPCVIVAASVIVLPLMGLLSTFLYFDLLSRHLKSSAKTRSFIRACLVCDRPTRPAGGDSGDITFLK